MQLVVARAPIRRVDAAHGRRIRQLIGHDTHSSHHWHQQVLDHLHGMPQNTCRRERDTAHLHGVKYRTELLTERGSEAQHHAQRRRHPLRQAKALQAVGELPGTRGAHHVRSHHEGAQHAAQHRQRGAHGHEHHARVRAQPAEDEQRRPGRSPTQGRGGPPAPDADEHAPAHRRQLNCHRCGGERGQADQQDADQRDTGIDAVRGRHCRSPAAGPLRRFRSAGIPATRMQRPRRARSFQSSGAGE